ncbi:hypothetical protein EDB80DRAFT_681268 [Ilyonectria destructans]|nr:hypothetical protein EDB80DRAFT_681268 [Ilyonectria destructans]
MSKPRTPKKGNRTSATKRAKAASQPLEPSHFHDVRPTILSDTDIDRIYRRAVNATALATVPEPEVISPPKEDWVNPQTLQKQPEPDYTTERQEDVLGKPNAPLNILADLGEVDIQMFKTHRVDDANARVGFLVNGPFDQAVTSVPQSPVSLLFESTADRRCAPFIEEAQAQPSSIPTSEVLGQAFGISP